MHCRQVQLPENSAGLVLPVLSPLAIPFGSQDSLFMIIAAAGLTFLSVNALPIFSKIDVQLLGVTLTWLSQHDFME